MAINDNAAFALADHTRCGPARELAAGTVWIDEHLAGGSRGRMER
jgi:hypothetical protein